MDNLDTAYLMATNSSPSKILIKSSQMQKKSSANKKGQNYDISRQALNNSGLSRKEESFIDNNLNNHSQYDKAGESVVFSSEHIIITEELGSGSEDELKMNETFN